MDWKKFPKHLRPPTHWPHETRRRVEAIIDEYAISDTGGLLLLLNYGNAEAREIECRAIILIEGATVLDRFKQKKAHPLLTVERDCRSQKIQSLKAMNLDLEPLNDRPGRK